MWSYANILLGKEKKEKNAALHTDAIGASAQGPESLTFANSQSKPVGVLGKFRQKMKDSPVFTSSMVNTAICAVALVGAVIEGLPVYGIALSIGLVANLMQGLLVKKREFNVEGALEDKQNPPGYADRVAQERQNKNMGGGFAPATA